MALQFINIEEPDGGVGLGDQAGPDEFTPEAARWPRISQSAPEDSTAELAAFLRVPPFPGGRINRFEMAEDQVQVVGDQLGDLIALIRTLRVGGTYWAAQPEMPPSYLLARSAALLDACKELATSRPVVLWPAGERSPTACNGTRIAEGECDPWHMLAGATAVVAEEGDDVCFIAAIMGIPTYLRSQISGRLEHKDLDAHTLLGKFLQSGRQYVNPFSGTAMGFREAIELCGFWRRLIDSNRGIAGGVGFAFWKQDNVAALLWDGSRPFAFLKSVPFTKDAPIAVWRSKALPDIVSQLDQNNVPMIEVEDGFLRSRGLGADCVPPLSLTVDRHGAYFDPAAPSELEHLLQDGEFDEQILDRARRLRTLIVEAGLGKYERGSPALDRPAGNRRHILVPGQVEDDRSVQTGGAGLVSNLALLARVREQSPQAYIIYKPHPDVVAGHRKGSIAERQCRQYADQVVRDSPISSLIAMADEVHVNTSLTGFESLLRNKPVTTYGVPFYAGWGLTRDLGPVPARRAARRTLDELVAATLLLYPRYLDPVTRLPCPAEVVVRRLCEGDGARTGLVVAVRRMQGKLMRRLRSLAQ